jgi:3-phosphoshikimate 1-carboxyvinyltransferase
MNKVRDLMILNVKKSIPCGSAVIPGSKSHTIRALFFASLAKGESVIDNPLVSDDTFSAARILRQLGAKIEYKENRFTVQGFDGRPLAPKEVLDVGNSGTTLRFAASIAALSKETAIITGDSQIQNRPIGPLLDALNDLGAKAYAINGNGSAPISVTGPIKGGRTEIECMSSQYLSLIVPSLVNERPYVEMTLWWMDKLGIEYKRRGFEEFCIKGCQKYSDFACSIPGDFSSATFFAVLAAISGGTVLIRNLRMDDPQGDKGIFGIIEKMGAEVLYGDDCVTVSGRELQGMDIDLNPMPDALPALAVLGCFAKGRTRLQNVPQARLKETDRISVMCGELKKMNADIYELEDGLEIYESKLRSACLSGHYDHRIVMALSLAGTMCEGVTKIDTAEAIGVTFPGFVSIMRDIGIDMETSEDD